MKNVLTSPSGMKATGVGPKIILVTLPFVAAGIVLHTYLPEYSRFSSVYPAVLIRTGMALTGVGASFYLAAMVQFIQGFASGKLLTSGAFGLSRNPIYASWIVFLLPGISLIFNNWWFLCSAVAMMLAFQKYIRYEEQILQEVFGKRYVEYSRRVGRIGFFPVSLFV